MRYSIIETISPVSSYIIEGENKIFRMGKSIFEAGVYFNENFVANNVGNTHILGESLLFTKFDSEGLFQFKKGEISLIHPSAKIRALVGYSKSFFVELGENQIYQYHEGEEIADYAKKQTAVAFKRIIGADQIDKGFEIAEDQLSCYNLPNFELLWSISDSEYGKHRTYFIGTVEDTLYLYIFPDILIAIDIIDGKIKWRLKNFFLNDTIRSHFSLQEALTSRTPIHWTLDKVNKKAYLLSRYYLIECNLENQVLTLLKDYTQMPLSEQKVFYHAYFHEGYLYYQGYSRSNSFFTDSIGIFDIVQNKIIWEYIHPIKGHFFIEPPQLNVNRLYVLDDQYVLHIFEQYT